MDVEPVLVGRARAADPPVHDSALYLPEDPEVLAEVQIGVQHIPLHQEPVAVLWILRSL
jgi:hypothetical protein